MTKNILYNFLFSVSIAIIYKICILFDISSIHWIFLILNFYLIYSFFPFFKRHSKKIKLSTSFSFIAKHPGLKIYQASLTLLIATAFCSTFDLQNARFLENNINYDPYKDISQRFERQINSQRLQNLNIPNNKLERQNSGKNLVITGIRRTTIFAYDCHEGVCEGPQVPIEPLPVFANVKTRIRLMGANLPYPSSNTGFRIAFAKLQTMKPTPNKNRTKLRTNSSIDQASLKERIAAKIISTFGKKDETSLKTNNKTLESPGTVISDMFEPSDETLMSLLSSASNRSPHSSVNDEGEDSCEDYIVTEIYKPLFRSPRPWDENNRYFGTLTGTLGGRAKGPVANKIRGGKYILPQFGLHEPVEIVDYQNSSVSAFSAPDEGGAKSASLITQLDTENTFNFMLFDIVLPHSPVPYQLCYKIGAPPINGTTSFPEWKFAQAAPWLTLKTYPVKSRYLLPLWIEVSLLVVLFVLSGLFSGLNLGLMSLDQTELRILEKSGSPNEKRCAKRIIPLRRRGNFLLCTLVFGNVLVNSTLTILLENLSSGKIAVVVSTIGITLFGEIIPQAVCARYGLEIGAKTVWITRMFMLITAPLAYPISLILDRILGEDIGSVYDRQRLIELVKLSSLGKEEVDIITGALVMKTKTVGLIMTPINDVYMVPYDSTLDFATLTDIVGSGYTRIPVFKDGNRKNIVGVLNIKDLAFVDPDDKIPLKTVLDFYDHPVIYVFEDTSLGSILEEFKKGSSHMAFVRKVVTEPERDPYYEITGLVTLEDVIEEIIQGEILDETDRLMDNRHKQLRQQKKLHDFSLFLRGMGMPGGPGSEIEYADSPLTPQMALVAYQFLNANIDAFREEYISGNVLRKLIRQPECLQAIRLKPGAEQYDSIASYRTHLMATNNNNADYQDTYTKIYTKNVPSDYFVLILEGRVRVYVGTENICFESGPFSYFGVNCLNAVTSNDRLLKSLRGILTHAISENYQQQQPSSLPTPGIAITIPNQISPPSSYSEAQSINTMQSVNVKKISNTKPPSVPTSLIQTSSPPHIPVNTVITSNIGASIISDNSTSQILKSIPSFIPDYNVEVITPSVLYLKIKRSQYLAALRATVLERMANAISPPQSSVDSTTSPINAKKCVAISSVGQSVTLTYTKDGTPITTFPGHANTNVTSSNDIGPMQDFNKHDDNIQVVQPKADKLRKSLAAAALIPNGDIKPFFSPYQQAPTTHTKTPQELELMPNPSTPILSKSPIMNMSPYYPYRHKDYTGHYIMDEPTAPSDTNRTQSSSSAGASSITGAFKSGILTPAGKQNGFSKISAGAEQTDDDTFESLKSVNETFSPLIPHPFHKKVKGNQQDYSLKFRDHETPLSSPPELINTSKNIGSSEDLFENTKTKTHDRDRMYEDSSDFSEEGESLSPLISENRKAENNRITSKSPNNIYPINNKGLKRREMSPSPSWDNKPGITTLESSEPNARYRSGSFSSPIHPPEHRGVNYDQRIPPWSKFHAKLLAVEQGLPSNAESEKGNTTIPIPSPLDKLQEVLEQQTVLETPIARVKPTLFDQDDQHVIKERPTNVRSTRSASVSSLLRKSKPSYYNPPYNAFVRGSPPLTVLSNKQPHHHPTSTTNKLLKPLKKISTGLGLSPSGSFTKSSVLSLNKAGKGKNIGASLLNLSPVSPSLTTTTTANPQSIAGADVKLQMTTSEIDAIVTPPLYSSTRRRTKHYDGTVTTSLLDLIMNNNSSPKI